MFDLIATVLAWFYDLWPSYGMAIVFLTLAVMLILTPLTLKGTRSMMMLQQLQPEVKKLQARYKDDRQKLNEEMLSFYKQNKINPLGGCLPLLVQMPVFFVLYQVLQGLTRSREGGFDPKYLDPSTALYRALDGAHEMVSWGMDLSRSATTAMRDGFGSAVPYLLLVFGVAATSYIQQKQVSGRNPNAPINPQQQMLLKLLPGFFALISLSLPAALVVYFFVSNLFRVGQQAVITHTIHKPMVASGAISTAIPTTGKEEPDKAAKPAKAPEASGPKGFLARFLGDASPRLGESKNGKSAANSGGDGPRRTRPTSRPTAKGGSGANAKGGSGASAKGGSGATAIGKSGATAKGGSGATAKGSQGNRAKAQGRTTAPGRAQTPARRKKKRK